MEGEKVFFRKRAFGGFNRDDVIKYLAKVADERNEAIAGKERALNEVKALNEEIKQLKVQLIERNVTAVADEIATYETAVANAAAAADEIAANVFEDDNSGNDFPYFPKYKQEVPVLPDLAPADMNYGEQPSEQPEQQDEQQEQQDRQQDEQPEQQDEQQYEQPEQPEQQQPEQPDEQPEQTPEEPKKTVTRVKIKRRYNI